jgi:hypothetical protein
MAATSTERVGRESVVLWAEVEVVITADEVQGLLVTVTTCLKRGSSPESLAGRTRTLPPDLGQPWSGGPTGCQAKKGLVSMQRSGRATRHRGARTLSVKLRSTRFQFAVA